MDFRDKINLLEKIDNIRKTENEIKSMETELSRKSDKLSKMKEEEVYVKFGELYYRLSQVQPQKDKLQVKVFFDAHPNADIEALRQFVEDYDIDVNIQIAGHNKDLYKDFYCSLTFPNSKAQAEDGTTPKDHVKFKKYDAERYVATIDLEDLKNLYIPVNINYIKNYGGATITGLLARCDLIDRYELTKLILDNADLQSKEL